MKRNEVNCFHINENVKRTSTTTNAYVKYYSKLFERVKFSIKFSYFMESYYHGVVCSIFIAINCSI